MALPLETEVMNDIGLGNHFSWFNGSRSCGGIRRQAAARLEQAIRARHDAGDPIAAPDAQLIRLVQRVADTEGSDERGGWEARETVLTRTWQAAATAIQAHIDAAAGSRQAISSARQHIRKRFLPARRRQPAVDMYGRVRVDDLDLLGLDLAPDRRKRKA